MRLMMKAFIAIVLLSLMPPLCNAQNDQVCLAMISEAAHNIGITTNSSEYYGAVYDNYCNSDGSTKKAGLSVGITLPIQGIPVSLTGNSTDDETRISTFCKNYSSASQSHTASYSAYSTVVDKAFQSATDCERISKTGNYITHKYLTPNTLVINLSIGGGSTLKIQGLSHTPGVGCVGRNDNNGTMYFDVGTSKTLDASLGNYTVTCTRPASDAGSGNVFYQEAGLALSTNIGGYNIYWPQDTVLPIRSATQIQAALASLKRDISSTDASAQASQAKLKSISDNLALPPTASAAAINPYGDPRNVRASTTLTCPDHTYLAGIKVDWAGTCNGQCNGDGGVPHAFSPICKSLF